MAWQVLPRRCSLPAYPSCTSPISSSPTISTRPATSTTICAKSTESVKRSFFHRAISVTSNMVKSMLQAVSYAPRSEEHTSELQSRQYLVCRLLLEKKNNKQARHSYPHHTKDIS